MEETNAGLTVDQVSENVKEKKDFSVLDLLRVPVFIVGKDQRVVYANDSFVQLLGINRNQVIGSLIGSMIQSEKSGVERALQGESAYIKSWATIRGKRYFFEYMPNPLIDSQ